MNFISSITLQFRDAFSSGFKSAEASFAGMQGALGDLGKNKDMNRLAADLAMASALTDPFRQKLSAMLDMPSQLAGTFDSSMRNIQSLTGETNKSLSELGKELLSIGGNAVAGPNEIANAYYNIASGIGRAEVRMDTLRAAVALAESGQADLGAATSGLISVVNAYNTPAENMGDLSDVFFQTVRKGVGSLDGFVSAMSSISGISASVGIGFDELGSAMAYLTAKGQTESVAATQLKAAMVSLLRPNEELSKALNSIGISSGSAMLEQYGLAESLAMVKTAVGGSQDKMAKALGSVEALQAALVITDDSYNAFAQSYAGGLSGATAAALEAQAQSYEARVSKLQAAQDALRIQIGDDVNAIKGFFVDMGTGFLTNVVSPIMGSPVGGVFQGIAAGVGLAAKGILDLGSGALNTASQLVVLTATLQNAGGFSKLFGSSLSLMSMPFKSIGVLALKAIGPIIAFGASLWAAMAPILPFIATGAALAALGVLIYKNWERIKEFFVSVFTKIHGLLAGVSNKVLAAVAVFMPIVGIPALIIKNWETIKAFFAGLWAQVSALFKIAVESIKNVFVAAWTKIKDFFASVWGGIINIVANVANWFGGVWASITGAFAAAWTWVSDLFASVWDGIKGVIMEFIAWLQPVIDIIIAPFKAVGAAIGGIINTVGGWFDNTVNKGNAKLAEIAENKMTAAAASPAEASTATSAAVVPTPLTAMGTRASPVPPADVITASAVPASASSGGNSLLGEHLAAASRKGISGNINAAASDAFMGASSIPAIDIADYSAEAAGDFSEALRPAQTQILQTQWNAPEAKKAKEAPRLITIQHLTLQADDTLNLINFIRQLEHAVLEPVEAAV